MSGIKTRLLKLLDLSYFIIAFNRLIGIVIEINNLRLALLIFRYKLVKIISSYFLNLS